jgi:hypothetical protein
MFKPKNVSLLIVLVFIFSGCRFESGRADESFQRGQGGRHGKGSTSQGTTTTIGTKKFWLKWKQTTTKTITKFWLKWKQTTTKTITNLCRFDWNEI